MLTLYRCLLSSYTSIRDVSFFLIHWFKKSSLCVRSRSPVVPIVELFQFAFRCFIKPALDNKLFFGTIFTNKWWIFKALSILPTAHQKVIFFRYYSIIAVDLVQNHQVLQITKPKCFTNTKLSFQVIVIILQLTLGKYYKHNGFYVYLVLKWWLYITIAYL